MLCKSSNVRGNKADWVLDYLHLLGRLPLLLATFYLMKIVFDSVYITLDLLGREAQPIILSVNYNSLNFTNYFPFIFNY